MVNPPGMFGLMPNGLRCHLFAVKLTNESSVAHNVTIAQGSKTLGATKTITKTTDTITLDLAPGDYVFFCSVPGHRQSGMQGTLTVQ